MLDYKEFKDRLRIDLVDYGGANVFEFTEVTRVNGKAEGIIVKCSGTNTHPVLYLEPLYNKYCQDCDMDKIVELVIAFKDKHPIQDELGDSMIYILKNKEEVLANVELGIMNYELNADFLSRAPHKRFEDLAVYYCIRKNDEFDRDVCYTVKLTNEALKISGIEESELWQCAYNNTKYKHQYKSTPIGDVLFKLFGEIPPVMPGIDMYVLTNERNIDGAVAILYPEYFQTLANIINSDLIIIPSSVHELLLIPIDDRFEMNLFETQMMIEEVNNTTLKNNEILSYSVYCYKRDTNSVIMVNEDEEF